MVDFAKLVLRTAASATLSFAIREIKHAADNSADFICRGSVYIFSHYRTGKGRCGQHHQIVWSQLLSVLAWPAPALPDRRVEV